MIAHPIIEAIISTLKDEMPSHMVSGTAWSTALKNAPCEKADKQTNRAQFKPLFWRIREPICTQQYKTMQK